MNSAEAGIAGGPGIRDYYLLHYIRKGRGVFRANGREYHLSAGQVFFIFPENISHYIADDADPWEYYWIGFGGGKAALLLGQAGVVLENPILTCKESEPILQCLESMMENYDSRPSHQLRFTGFMHIFMSYLLDSSLSGKAFQGCADQYFGHAVEYIVQNYSHSLKVGELAAFIGIDRKYLYQIFKRNCSLSPEEYIIRFRMDKACELMGNKALSISAVAHSAGYGDALLFSKMFKKRFGVPPSEYRRIRTY